MKKTLTINLNGRVFHIDEDAYQLLDNYLKNLRIHFRKEEGCAEILADFEARIEELFSQKLNDGFDVINIVTVERVIAQMGNPSDFGEDDSAEEPRTEPQDAPKKKFYRDPDDKMLAGVCSGLAAYFGWEVLPVRILAVIFIIMSGFWLLVAYFIAWMITPAARTAEQKLKMQGKPVTVENIGKTVASGVEDVRRTAENSGCIGGFLDFIVALFKVCLVGLGILVGLPLLFALGVVVIVIFATIFGVGTGILGSLIPWAPATFLFVDNPVIATVGMCLVIGIPLAVLLYALVSWIFKLKPVNKWVKLTGLLLWLAALVALPFSGFKADWRQLRYTNWNWESIQGNGQSADRVIQLSPFQSLEVSRGLDIDLQVEQNADSNTLFISGESNLLDYVETYVSGGNLVLRTKHRRNLIQTMPLTVRLQTADFNKLDVHGAVKINWEKPWKTESFELDASGASQIDIADLQVNRLDLDASGASKITIAGSAQTAELDASGASKIEAFDLSADRVDADASGASKINCNPINYLDAEASGASKIQYRTEPKNKSVEASGASRISVEAE